MKSTVLVLFFFILFIIGCGKEVTIIKTSPAERPQIETSKPTHENINASNHHLQQAKLFYEKDRFKQARQHCEKAISFDSRNWEAYYYLGLTMQRQKDYVIAIEKLNEGLKVAPDNGIVRAEIHYAIGYSWERIGRLVEAGMHYDRALGYNPEYDSAREGKDRVKAGKRSKKWGKDKEIDGKG